MTNTELELLSTNIQNNPIEFFTTLEAHNLGYDTHLKELLTSYNKQKIIHYSLTSKPTILTTLLDYYGKLERVNLKYAPSINPHIYTEDILFNDISKDNLNNYLSVFNYLSDKCKQKCFTLLDTDNMSYITTNEIDIPIKYINESIKLNYVRWKLSKPDALDFLMRLNDSVFIYRNYNMLKNQVVDQYIMSNITYFNDQTVDNLVAQGIPISTIYKYHKDKSFKYILNHLRTIADLKMILKDIPTAIGIEQIGTLYEKFPMYKDVIDYFVIRTINE